MKSRGHLDAVQIAALLGYEKRVMSRYWRLNGRRLSPRPEIVDHCKDPPFSPADHHPRWMNDEPARFRKSRAVGAHFGLPPRTHQSGELDRRAHITRRGDEPLRCALYDAALVMLQPIAKPCALKAWGLRVAKRRRPTSKRSQRLEEQHDSEEKDGAEKVLEFLTPNRETALKSG